MTHTEIREKFLKFFQDRGHKIVPSSSLLPNDPSVLFTTAGMQQFKPYFMGTTDPIKDFGTKRVASIQKSMRTSDIDEVGDKSHFTFFEMLGHFSFGDYFKKETIQWTYEFLTEKLGISKDRISATVFAGDDKIPFDSESYDAWAQLIPQEKIKKGSREDNVWGPAGPEGPCGAANEVYVDDLEVATLVFMEYYCGKDQNLNPLPQKGVDVGWGFERIVQIVQGKESVFEIDLLDPVIKLVPMELDDRVKRIIADHSRAIVFLIMDGVRPSNKEQGYILRRLMRRIITYFHASQSVDNRHSMSVIHRHDVTVMHDIFAKIIEIYGYIYSELNANTIIHEFDREKEKFEKTLAQGLKELEKMDSVNAGSAFKLYESFGLPFEIVKELSGSKAKDLNEEAFEMEFKKHQEISRAGAEKKFGGHGLLMDAGELKAGNEEELKKATRLHTATHLLHASLRKVLGTEVHQAGSDITPERLRFDFTFPRKITPEELKQVEDMVNDAVKKELPVIKTEMSYQNAINSGALAFFKQKYPERVNVYSIGEFSKELCGGPHVSNTLEVGKFKIIKEESISAGVRRIRAVVE
ncbi:MAG: alanine--tRNA ligase [Candidatus Yanofskybacteria bacterium]|nr:alanine--tRNA ligase [Candidatus Yanofskybacteria bacterium]